MILAWIDIYFSKKKFLYCGSCNEDPLIPEVLSDAFSWNVASHTKTFCQIGKVRHNQLFENNRFVH